MRPILHITTETLWAAAQDANIYRGDTLDSEGFIHCSMPDQLLEVANDHFNGQAGLVLLVINPAEVPAEIRYEDCYHSGQAFPHIYGPLPIVAVSQVLPFPPEAGGTFQFPEHGSWLLDQPPGAQDNSGS